VTLETLQLGLTALLPEVIVALGATALLLIEVGLRGTQRELVAPIAAAILLGAIVAFSGQGIQSFSIFNGMAIADPLGAFLGLILLVVGLLAVLLSRRYLAREHANRPGYYPLLLFATVGMMLLARSTDLAAIFVSIELLSLCLYVLAGFTRRRPEALEAGLKYLMLGGFATGFLLFGIALMYVTTAHTEIFGIVRAIPDMFPGEQALFAVGVGLFLVGVAFKLGLAPFHMWTPDVYHGAPAPVTAFMAAGVKVAVFGAVLRVFPHGLMSSGDTVWPTVLAALAVASMTVGNVIALAQRNIKRMLAYSSIAHAGYALVGVVAGDRYGDGAVLFYLVAYALMTVGAFAVVTAMAGDREEGLDYADAAGLAQRDPLLAATMTVFMVSLTGIPPTLGFVGKFYLFASAVYAGWAWLAIAGVINSAISAYYYLGVVVAMYMREPIGESRLRPRAIGVTTVLVATVVGLLALGLAPGRLLQLVGFALSSR